MQLGARAPRFRGANIVPARGADGGGNNGRHEVGGAGMSRWGRECGSMC